MRGKTNATNGVHLNAAVVNKTVKSGQIVAGDFVEYYTEPNIVPQSAVNRYVCTVGDYTVTRKGTGIALFKGIEQVDEYLDYNVLCACQYDDFVVFFSSSNIIGVLEIDTVNDELSLVDTVSAALYDAAYDDASTIGAGDGMVLACTQYRYSQNEVRYKFALVDISVSGELSNCTITSYITGNNWFYIHIDNYDGNFSIIGSQNNTLGYRNLIIDQNRKITFGTYIELHTYYFVDDKMLQHDQYVIYAGYSSSYDKVACLDISNGTCNILAVEGTPTTNIENGKFITCDSSTRILRLYSYDESTKEVVLLDTLGPVSQPYPTYASNGMVTGFINGDDVLICTGTTSGMRRFKIHGNHLEEIPEIDYVVPYYGSGDPIGVAQTDGVTNDVIPVYIPTYTP